MEKDRPVIWRLPPLNGICVALKSVQNLLNIYKTLTELSCRDTIASNLIPLKLIDR